MLIQAIVASLSTLALAGPLSPPQGPPRSTGIELSKIEPRVSINDLPGDEGAVALITAPGHYILTADLMGQAGKSSIRVTAPGDITIDLNGYSILAIPPSITGLEVTAPLASGGGGTTGAVYIFGGRIADFPNTGISTTDRPNVRVERVTIERCGTGIRHLHSENIVHRDIAVRNCTAGPGIDINSTDTPNFQYDATNVVSTGNASHGLHVRCPDGTCRSTLTDVHANNNAGDGLLFATFPPVPASDGRNYTYKVVRTSSFSGNTGNGVTVTCPANSPVRCAYAGVNATGNTGDGINIATNVAPPNHEGSTAEFQICHLASNGGSGLDSHNPVYVESTTASENVLYGMSIEGPDPLMLMGTIVDTHLTRNGDDNGRLRRGRFICVASQFSGGGGDGVDLEEGCLLLDRCSITRNTENGINVLGTLNATHTNSRRNGAAGVSVTGGSVVCESLVAEHNGTTSAAGGMTFVDCPSITLARCVSSDNFGPGFRSSGSGNIGPIRWMAPESISQRNSGNGFDLGDGTAVLTDCEAHANGGTGFLLRNTITGGRVERCTALANAAGFVVEGSGCLVIDNRASTDAIGGFAIGANNTATPVVGRQEVQSGQMGNHPNITQF